MSEFAAEKIVRLAWSDAARAASAAARRHGRTFAPPVKDAGNEVVVYHATRSAVLASIRASGLDPQKSFDKHRKLVHFASSESSARRWLHGKKGKVLSVRVPKSWLKPHPVHEKAWVSSKLVPSDRIVGAS